MRIMILAFAGALLLGQGCAMLPKKHRVETAARPLNVVILTAESMNTKHLSLYGNERKTSPHLDAFAKTAVKFDWCVGASAWTSESVVSLLTGMPSPVHGVVTRNRNMDPRWFTPMEILRDAGYDNPRMSAYQVDQNYSHVGFTGEMQITTPEVWLEQHKDKPFFMWHHLLDTHLPYKPAGWAKEKFWRDDLIPNEASRHRVLQVQTNGVLVAGAVDFKPEEDLPAITALYEADVLMMDAEFGRIVKKIEDLGLRDDTLIIFCADHGEELLEHGYIGHGSTSKQAKLFDELTHLPLLLSLPGRIPAGGVVTQQVRTVDIMPTVFDLLGLPQRDYFMGESLQPLWRDPTGAGHRIAFSSSSMAGYKEDDPDKVTRYVRSVRAPPWKLIRHEAKGLDDVYELYHLEQDPGEKVNLMGRHPGVEARLVVALDQWLRTCGEWTDRRLSRKENVEPVYRRSLWAIWMEYLFPPEVLDLTGVDSPPKMIWPLGGEVITHANSNGRVHVKWTGKPGIPYLLELDFGSGDYHFNTYVRSDVPEMIREFDAPWWNTYAVQYSPARLRVKIDRPEHEWSGWTSVELK